MSGFPGLMWGGDPDGVSKVSPQLPRRDDLDCTATASCLACQPNRWISASRRTMASISPFSITSPKCPSQNRSLRACSVRSLQIVSMSALARTSGCSAIREPLPGAPLEVHEDESIFVQRLQELVAELRGSIPGMTAALSHRVRTTRAIAEN
jgi:hypothetical protein